MRLDELVALVQEQGIVCVSEKLVRDACGYGKLFDSVVTKIKRRLDEFHIGYGSNFIGLQDSEILLFDNRDDSRIQKLFRLVSDLTDGKARTWDDLKSLRRAVDAFTNESVLPAR